MSAPAAAGAARRAVCTHCLRAQTACICHWIRPLGSASEVVILQSPLETGQAKGSARLLHLSLPGSVLVAGEVFAPDQLARWLHGPLPACGGVPGSTVVPVPAHENARVVAPVYPVLLYPAEAHDPGLGVAPAPPLAPDFPPPGARVRLIVLDGTWRKSRKMLYQNPLLQTLPRLGLAEVPASRYLVRKAHKPGQLSTLEAVCLALGQIEGAPQRYDALLAAFDGFVAELRVRQR